MVMYALALSPRNAFRMPMTVPLHYAPAACSATHYAATKHVQLHGVATSPRGMRFHGTHLSVSKLRTEVTRPAVSYQAWPLHAATASRIITQYGGLMWPTAAAHIP